MQNQGLLGLLGLFGSGKKQQQQDIHEPPPHLGQRQVFGGHASNQSSLPLARTLLWSEPHIDFLVSHEVAHLYHADNHVKDKRERASGFFGALLGGGGGGDGEAVRPPAPDIANGYTPISELGLSENHTVELKADERAAAMAPEIALGGLEHLHKKLAFGRVLRAATLADERFAAKNTHDESGDFQSESHPKLMLRAARLEAILKAHHGLEVEVRRCDEPLSQVTQPLARVVVKDISGSCAKEVTQKLDELVRKMTTRHGFQYTYSVGGLESEPLPLPSSSTASGAVPHAGRHHKKRKKKGSR